MDIKSEVEIKDELLESSDDFIYNVHRFEQVSVLEEIQENMFYPNVDVKEEIEIKSLQHEDLFYPSLDIKEEIELKIDPLYIKEENTESGYHVDQISGLDDSQTLVGDGEEYEKPKMENFVRNRPPTSSRDQLIEKENLKKILYECCYKFFENLSDLKDHLKNHINQRFRCPHCSYGYNYKLDLQVHMLKHSKTNLFKCSYCNYESSCKADINSHMLLHAKNGSIKVFKCFNCNFEVNQKGKFKKHLLTHFNFKPLKCRKCKKVKTCKCKLNK
ncbi:UNVERIFIED_CONTAM: hypothetical protein RMT77_014823 [Armadillidium vulgare]